MEVPLEISVEGSGEKRVVFVRGEVDFATAPEFDETVQKLIDEGATSIIFDFENVTFLDSEGLKVLLRAQRRLSQRQGVIRLTHCRRTITRAFEVLGLEERFEIDCQE
jgi:anti-anti-sigma factor